MKNFVLLLIDSLNYSHVKSSDIELMPFLSGLKNKGLYCENMYAEAPYTEAALMSIICGQDVLDHGGYMYRYRDTPITIFEAMKKKGFETFTNSYEPQCFPSSVKRGIDICVNGVGYDVGALWTYRIKHYSRLYKSSQITESDYDTVDAIIKDNLESWLEWTDNLINNTVEASMIKDNAPQYDPVEVQKKVKAQYESYLTDSKAYIEDLLKKGHAHEIFGIEGYAQLRKIKNRDIVEYAKQEFYPLFRQIRRMDFLLNVRNGSNVLKGPVIKIGQFLKKPSEESLKNVAKAILLSVNALFDLDLFKRIKEDCDRFKDSPSLRSEIDYYIDWAKGRKNTDKPHFAFIHVCDIHNPEIFFTYDTENKELLNSEKIEAEKLLREIPVTYSGSLTHDLSLKYIDGVIQYFYQQLEKNRLDKDTVVIICADHGFSFSGNPLRDTAVVNLFLENYSIPFIVTGTSYKGHCVSKKCESKDIPATICDLVDGEIPKEFTGNSVLSKKEYKNLRIEYCGGGCPDLLRRELKIAAFDEEYFVGTLGLLDETSENIITEIYDLKKDPIQLKNLVGKKYDRQKVREMFDAILERKKEIKTSNEKLNNAS